MSKIIPESKIISVQHKSLIGAVSGNENNKSSGVIDKSKKTGSFSQMSVSDKKIRTLERNRNISPAPFQIDSTDTEDELEVVVGSVQLKKSKIKNKTSGPMDSEETAKNSNNMARTVSQEIRSAFSLTTEFKT